MCRAARTCCTRSHQKPQQPPISCTHKALITRDLLHKPSAGRTPETPPQVSKTFRKLQAAAITDAADARAVAAAAGRDYPSLRAVPSAAFPLFVTTAQWLRLLDASCDVPFFAGGGDGAEGEDADGIGLHVDLGGWDEDEEEEGEEEEDEEGDGEEGTGEEGGDGGGSGSGGEEEEGAGERALGGPGSTVWAHALLRNRGAVRGRPAAALGTLRPHVSLDSLQPALPRPAYSYGQPPALNGAAPPATAPPALRGQEVRFEDFVGRDMWGAVTKGLAKEERTALKAPLVYQEVGRWGLQRRTSSVITSPGSALQGCALPCPALKKRVQGAAPHGCAPLCSAVGALQ